MEAVNETKIAAMLEVGYFVVKVQTQPPPGNDLLIYNEDRSLEQILPAEEDDVVEFRTLASEHGPPDADRGDGRTRCFVLAYIDQASNLQITLDPLPGQAPGW